jgi:adhesin transport system outer membrane protein
MRSRHLFLKPRPSFPGRWLILGVLLAGLFVLLRSPQPRSLDEFPWQPPIEPQGVMASDAAKAPAMEASATPEQAALPVVSTPASAPAAVAPEPALAASTPEPARVPDADAQIRQSLDRWSRAWSTRNMPAYLAAYAPNFVPESGQNRLAWEQSRQQRILSKQTITHEIRNLQISIDGDNKATARFEQTYVADGLRLVGPKVLRLERTAQAWLIVAETTH